MDIKAAVAELERKMIAIRTKRAMDEAKRQGLHLGRPPLGFVIGQDGKLHPDALGIKVINIMREVADPRAKTVQAQLGVDYHKAWELLRNCKQFVGRMS